jgi:hypothetical protein
VYQLYSQHVSTTERIDLLVHRVGAGHMAPHLTLVLGHAVEARHLKSRAVTAYVFVWEHGQVFAAMIASA